MTAPLSDPSAKPGMEYLPAVDAGKLSIVLEHCAQSSSFACFTPPGWVSPSASWILVFVQGCDMWHRPC